MTKKEFLRSTVREYSGAEFIDHLEGICETLHNALDVLTFGMIIYDESVPEYRKLLRDDDYWTALDRASGDRLLIFTMADKEGSSALAISRFMVAFEPTGDHLGSSYSVLLKTVFGDESLLVYPSVLFFQVWKDDVYDYRLVPLARADTWESFKSVQDLLSSIFEVLNHVAPEHFGCAGSRQARRFRGFRQAR